MVVGPLIVLSQIQPHLVHRLVCSQPNQGIDHLENDPAHREAIDRGQRHVFDLRPDLATYQTLGIEVCRCDLQHA